MVYFIIKELTYTCHGYYCVNTICAISDFLMGQIKSNQYCLIIKHSYDLNMVDIRFPVLYPSTKLCSLKEICRLNIIFQN